MEHNNMNELKNLFYTAIKYAAVLATLVFILLMIFPEAITRLFTSDVEVLKETPPAMRWVFAATPIIAIQLIGAAYFQAVGKAIPALLLTLTRQGFFFIPFIFILPNVLWRIWCLDLFSNFRCIVNNCYWLFFTSRNKVKIND